MHEDDMEEEMKEGQSLADRRREREGMDKYLGNKPDNLNPLSHSKQGYNARMDDSLGGLHREGDDVEGEVDEMWGGKKHEYKRTKGHKTGNVDGHYKDYEELPEGELEETSRLKAGPNTSFSRMAGQKIWGKKYESRKPRKANLGESRIRKSYNLLKEEVESLKTKNEEYKTALVTFKDKLNEVGVFNSNLAYVTRLFTEHSTTKQEKINILKRFDSVKTLKESKVLYKVIKEEFSQDVEDKSKTISEAVERKITKSSTSGSGGKLLESKVYENPQFSRMKDLMSKL